MEEYYHLRKAKDKDVETIFALIKRASKEGQLLYRSKADIRNHLKTFFVWDEPKAGVVACCGLTVYSKKLGEVRSLAVKHDFQNNGIGRSLVVACLELAKKKRIYEVLAITDKVGFFDKMGFSKWLGNQFPMIIRP